jgi:hypothetical protein
MLDACTDESAKLKTGEKVGLGFLDPINHGPRTSLTDIKMWIQGSALVASKEDVPDPMQPQGRQ